MRSWNTFGNTQVSYEERLRTQVERSVIEVDAVAVELLCKRVRH